MAKSKNVEKKFYYCGFWSGEEVTILGYEAQVVGVQLSFVLNGTVPVRFKNHPETIHLIPADDVTPCSKKV